MQIETKGSFLNDRLDWNLLRTFLAIVEEHSISRAAERLHLTQPAISQSLRRLEESLGQRLIERRGPRFEITRAGEEVRRIAEEIYGNISRLSSELGELGDSVSGSVRLLSVSGVYLQPYDDFLAGFHRANPRIDLQVEVMRSSEVISTLLQKTATAGLSPSRVPVKKLERRLFMRQRYAIFCGRHHRLFGQPALTTEDLLSENFVSFTGDQIGDNLSPLTIFRDEKGFKGRVVASSSSVHEVRRLIFAGFGIGCLPEHVAQPDVAQQRLQRLPPGEGVADVDIHLLWSRERKYSQAETLFLVSLNQWLEKRERLGQAD
ncbi:MULTISPECIES: LysR family transcriptional regulator [Vogesella]|jgi:DNA-binding transcriptional LysR family regulator|uniref:LysR family transcriptional regulator n=1 Tax=Vogesella indigofera TaxID=45465 RepID=A0ABT5I3F1_VOGIN|nr:MULTISPECIES: LysR family transcriptional regulator [Vogesella]MCQ4143387.1 LysR family transcriptional regulator [Vogesella sp. AC12]MDC7690707.1 LysR family transcriptional regulator [Vogesella indigofera]